MDLLKTELLQKSLCGSQQAIACRGRGGLRKASASQSKRRIMALCRPCERRLKNFTEFKGIISESQRYFERSERVKRCIDVSPSAPRTLKTAKDQKTSRRGLSFPAVAAEEQLSVQSCTEKEVRTGK